MNRTILAILILISCAFPICAQPKANKKREPDNRPVWKPEKKVDVIVTDEALGIHNSGQLFDGHNDLPWTMRRRADSSFKKVDIAQPTKFHTDIPRLKKGGLKAQFWSVYVPASTDLTGNALLQTLEQIDIVDDMIKTYPDEFAIAKNADGVEAIIKQGKIASMMGVEGGHSIQGSLSVLQKFHDRGVRYMTLTHSRTLAWADSCTDEPKNNGLSPFGKDVVREMNRIGILVDLSHVSDKTMKDALEITEAPVIFSHSSARAICDHPRNVPDDVLKLVQKNGGVVMVNFASGFICPTEQKKKYKNAKGTIYDVVDHIEHIIKVAGIDHVGIGSDYDGIRSLPIGLEDVSTYPRITQILLDRGYKEKQIHKILGGNVLRVMRESENVAKRLQQENKPPVSKGELIGQVSFETGNVDRARSTVALLIEDTEKLPRESCRVRLELDKGQENFGQLILIGSNLAIVQVPVYDLKKNQSLTGKLYLLPAKTDQQFNFERNGDLSTKLKFGDRIVAEYMQEPVDNSTKERRGETYKVYHHVYAADGKTRLTKGPGGLYPHHRGIFLGFNKISYGDKKADIWHCNNGESQTHAGFKQTAYAGPFAASQTAYIDWNGRDGEPFIREERTLYFRNFRDGLMIEFWSTLNSVIDEPITLDGDPQHAGVQFRASQHVPDKTKNKTYYIRPDGKGEPGKFRNWPANKDHAGLPWNAMCFVVEGKTYTCVYMDHPDNPKNTRFSERDYGRFGAYFKHTLVKGKPLRVKYRYWIQEGELTVDEINRLSNDFREPITTKIIKSK